MRIIESFLESKTGILETCEDGYLITEHYAVFVDGASAKSNFKEEI